MKLLRWVNLIFQSQHMVQWQIFLETIFRDASLRKKKIFNKAGICLIIPKLHQQIHYEKWIFSRVLDITSQIWPKIGKAYRIKIRLINIDWINWNYVENINLYDEKSTLISKCEDLESQLIVSLFKKMKSLRIDIVVMTKARISSLIINWK